MEHIFYFFTIYIIWLELGNLNNTELWIEDKRKILAFTEGKVEPRLLLRVLNAMIYLGWTIAGLFSSQYILFVFLLILSLIPKRENVVAIKLDSFITILILTFIIVNKYHLHWF